MLSLIRLPLLLAISVFLVSFVDASPLRYGSRYDVLERRGCGTHIDLDTRWEMEEGLFQARSDTVDLYAREDVGGKDKDGKTSKPLKPVSFDVYWHVVYANETKNGGHVTDDQIHAQMDVLNTDFKSTNISWTLKNITRIQNDDWFVNVWPGSPQEQDMKKTYHKGDSSVLNIFTAQFNSTTKSLGFASLPSAYLRQPLSDGLIIRHSTLPGGTQPNYNHGRTTVHEVGHWLGLYHTFEGGCEGVGDNIEDTAPEASESVGCPVGRKSCPGSKLEDPIHNFMDYSWDTCMTHFTPGQAKRMHEVIWAFRTKRAPSPSTSSASASASALTIGRDEGEIEIALRQDDSDESFERGWELFQDVQRGWEDDGEEERGWGDIEDV